MPLSKSAVPKCLQLLFRSFFPAPIFVHLDSIQTWAFLEGRGLRSGREHGTQMVARTWRTRFGRGGFRRTRRRRTWTSTQPSPERWGKKKKKTTTTTTSNGAWFRKTTTTTTTIQDLDLKYFRIYPPSPQNPRIFESWRNF